MKITVLCILRLHKCLQAKIIITHKIRNRYIVGIYLGFPDFYQPKNIQLPDIAFLIHCEHSWDICTGKDMIELQKQLILKLDSNLTVQVDP